MRINFLLGARYVTAAERKSTRLLLLHFRSRSYGPFRDRRDDRITVQQSIDVGHASERRSNDKHNGY